MTTHAPDTLYTTLHDAFGFTEFRPQQEDAVRGALSGRDVLVVMPTGAGKSLCFQLPALLDQGTTIVVSPLIALMRDQVDALNRRPVFQKAGCASLSSLQDQSEQRTILDKLRSGRLRLLYVAPERFRSPSFLETLKTIPIARLVVDEAHCISEWGHDFRPDYLTLSAVADALGRPPVTAVTATATTRVQSSILTNLAMRDPVSLVGGFNRPNLHWSVVRASGENERLEKLHRALPKLSALGGSGLIYVPTRKLCESVAHTVDAALTPLGQRAGLYHAGLPAEWRTQMQNEWLSGERQVLVATNAFGMGIDKPDVRFVIHCGYPDSLESYYQEAGRAGRDGRKSRVVILTCFTDRRTREWFLDNDVLTVNDVQAAHRRLIGQAMQGKASGVPAHGTVLTLSRYAWTQAHEASETKGRRVLGELERADLIERLSETADEIILRLCQPTFSSVLFGRIALDLQKQRNERLRRLNEMTDYCKTNECRRRTVLHYFGDPEQPQSEGWCCDNCDRKSAGLTPVETGRTRLSAVAPPTVIHGDDLHSLLEGLDALRPPVGKTRLNQLLRGANSQGVARFAAEHHPLFGALSHGSVAQVTAFLDALIARGLLHQAGEDDYFVCTVTQAGRDLWQGRLECDIPVPGARRRSAAPFARNGSTSGDTSSFAASARGDDADMDEALFERLRSWRRLEASALNLPPYCVFSDKTLREIARHQPQSDSDLQSITGVGAAKRQKYGPSVLAVVQGVSGD